MTTLQEKFAALEKVLYVMDEIRLKCPWDKEQTNETLRMLTIEETYELAEAVLEGKSDLIKKELGDLLLHLLFYSKIGQERGDFDFGDVMNAMAEKIIFRHPHVFGDVSVENQEEVKKNWEELKLKEKSGNGSVLGGVPKSLPAVVKAYRLQAKARGVGFDWDKKEDVWDKVTEELNELKHEIANFDKEKTEAEFGDLLFSVINAARMYDIDPELALERTNQKFIYRFNYLESETRKKGINLKDMTLQEMDVYWNEAKRIKS